MAYYEARFGDTLCQVQTDTVQMSKGPSFHAQVFMVDEERRHVHPLRDSAGEIQAFIHESEAGALTLAREYLQQQFGAPDGSFELTTGIPVRAPE